MILYACSILTVIPEGPTTRIEQSIIFVSVAMPADALAKAGRYCANRWPGKAYHVVAMPVPAIRSPIWRAGEYVTMN